MKGVIIAGTGSGVGKTTLTAGILHRLSKTMKVQAFKIGPDFIDPMYHTAATGRCSRNLDSFLMDDETIKNSVGANTRDADICVIEGVRGLYEGSQGDSDAGSTAHIAKILGLPVVLVLDAGSLTRSAAAIVNGFRSFDPEVRIKGVILNKVSGPQHSGKLDVAMETYCKGIRVLGKIRRDREMEIGQRHLGLSTSEAFNKETVEKLDTAGDMVDTDGLLDIAENCEVNLPEDNLFKKYSCGARIAVPKDKAYSFYYRENLECLSESGIEPVYFDAAGGDPLPDADAVYLGGGYPELYCEEISGNRDFLEGLRAFADENKPVYGECGGLMTMCGSLESKDGRVFPMSGIFDSKAVFTNVRHGPAYVVAEGKENNPLFRGRMKGHEYHYSDVFCPENAEFGIDVMRGNGISGKKDGLVYRRSLGCYMHQHALSYKDWAKGFRDCLN